MTFNRDVGVTRCEKTGKIRYENYGLALAAQTRYEERDNLPPGTMDIYPCDGCNNFHIGHASPSKIKIGKL